METRSTRSTVAFPFAFALPGSDDLYPAGDYDLVIEEERLQGLTFDAYRRTGMYLQITGNARFPGRTEMRQVSDADLRQALGHDYQPAADAGKTTDADTAPGSETTPCS